MYRPLLRSVAVRGASPSFRQTPFSLKFNRSPPLGLDLTPPIHIRTVASTVSNKPASQTLDHAATNVKEELGNSAADLAKVIAGANVTSDSVSNSKVDSFVGIMP